MPAAGFKKPEMHWQQRKQLYHQLHGMLRDGELPRGSFTGIAIDYPVGVRTLSKTWRDLRQVVHNFLQTNNGLDANGNRTIPLPDHLFHTRKKNSGQNAAKWDVDALKLAVRDVPLNERQTFRGLARRLGVPVTTLRALTKKGAFRLTTS